MSFVDIRNLSFAYSRKSKIIENFSFSMAQGEIVGILGPSGRGKSTLLRLIAGLESPTEGSITIAGKTVLDSATFIPPETRGVGMVFQDYALFPHLSVAKNVQFGLHKLSAGDRAKRSAEMLNLVQMADFAQRYPHELSGGQQQRVALARALAPQPALLLMDEPFSNLDAGLKEHIRSELRSILRTAKMTCMFVTHDERDVEAICDRVFTMA
ncbi:ABC transporter ATP-binding protein [Paenibacillus xerothermodurans]|uniref:Carnitine transport ATP-binding protein OpuCA n=1 Tax=Paenibacillus xerothermodurans TaxID=1977292 RepID=A0A2W1N6P8_PAEXE|nr:ABC transporter ATP-binding protein [Paenibacillus xerothermodurans]PZE19474.1 ABC transporter ATP-binding protein [Paenibacillus xerothermodurans]